MDKKEKTNWFLCVLYNHRLTLQEEVDELRVQAAVDAATVHELRVNLQAQREGQWPLIPVPWEGRDTVVVSDVGFIPW